MYDIKPLAIIIIISPLLGAIMTGLFGKALGKRNSHLIACGLMTISFAASCYLLYGFLQGKYQPWNRYLYTWANSGGINIGVGFLLDNLSVLMVAVVNFVSLMVHVYSIGYMHDDPGYQRFFCYISLFTFAMLTLVMANNFMQLFFGWEGVGVLSYLLIGFWFDRPSATFANLKAFLVNRVGDVGFIVAIAAVLNYTGSLDYTSVFAQASNIAANSNAINLICIGLFIGAAAKSAQIPLHVWLPDSMEGPTPISALIHAATMVTAGVFMIARMSPLFEYSEMALTIILIIGALTTFMMGLVAIVQTDIKRIIAYSTLSQLGYMVVALGASAYAAGILHLVTHAFFKSILFLAAGSVIIALHHEQDIMQMGNLRRYMPITFAAMLIGILSMIGLPGMAGFYSKDLIIETVAMSKVPGATFAYYIVLFSVFITAIYSFRLLFLVFYTDARMSQDIQQHLHESPKVITIPLLLLSIPAIISGGILISQVVHGFFGSAIFVLPQHDVISEFAVHDFSGALNMFLHSFTSLPVYFALAGGVAAWLCYIKLPDMPNRIIKFNSRLYLLLIDKFGFDKFNAVVIVPIVNSIANICSNFGDKTCIDGVVVNGSARVVVKTSGLLRRLQSGYLYNYTFMMIAGLFVILLWFFVLRKFG
jgi:NADH-quinone oxidoreductase subunit L